MPGCTQSDHVAKECMETAHPTPEQLTMMAMERHRSPHKATGNRVTRDALQAVNCTYLYHSPVDGGFSPETEPFSSLPLAGSLSQFPHLEERMLIDFTLVLLS